MVFSVLPKSIIATNKQSFLAAYPWYRQLEFALLSSGRGRGIAQKMFKILPGTYSDPKPEGDTRTATSHEWAVAQDADAEEAWDGSGDSGGGGGGGGGAGASSVDLGLTAKL